MERLDKEMDKRTFFFAAAAFRDYHPWSNPAENSFKHRKNEKPVRPDTADVNDENSKI